jgi:hypothetical protein
MSHPNRALPTRGPEARSDTQHHVRNRAKAGARCVDLFEQIIVTNSEIGSVYISRVFLEVN